MRAAKADSGGISQLSAHQESAGDRDTGAGDLTRLYRLGQPVEVGVQAEGGAGQDGDLALLLDCLTLAGRFDDPHLFDDRPVALPLDAHFPAPDPARESWGGAFLPEWPAGTASGRT